MKTSNGSQTNIPSIPIDKKESKNSQTDLASLTMQVQNHQRESTKKIKTKLDSKEIIPVNHDENIVEKNRPLDFLQGALLQKISTNTIDETNAKLIIKSIKGIQGDIVSELMTGEIEVSKDTEDISELVERKDEKLKINKEGNIIEDSIRQQKIKEHNENKENLQNKIKLLDENIKLLESVDFSKIKPDVSTGNIIEQNIKKDKIKEIKTKKDILESKVQTIEHQIKDLLAGENDLSQAKKNQIKQFLENFERDKSIDRDKYKRWEAEREERILHFAEIQKKNEEKAKEELQRQRDELEAKRKEEHRVYLEKIQARNQENKEKANKAKEGFKNKIEPRKYGYEKLEEEFRLKQLQMEEEKQKTETLEKLKRKNNLRPIRKEELDEFQKSYLERRQELILQKDKDRILKTEELLNNNTKMLKPDSEFYKKVVQEDRAIKENEEKKKVEKIYKNLKAKNFSKVVKDNLLPRIDEVKRQEIEERLIKAKPGNHQHYKRKNVYDVKLKKKNPGTAGSRPKTCSAENKVEYYETNANEQLNEKNSRPNSGDSPRKLKPIEVRKPLEKAPDYLVELRMRRRMVEGTDDHNLTHVPSKNKWDKMINNKKYSLVENVEMIKQRASYLEEKAKEEERFIELNGGAVRNPELGEKMSGMLIEAIKAKLAILNSASVDAN